MSTDQLCFNLLHGNEQICGISLQQRLKSAEWPPCFDGNGVSYVFDAVSSMFYEPRSNFFYDPKTSLYYGNEKKTYYRYNSQKSPPFEKVFASNYMKTLESSFLNSSMAQGIQARAFECNQGSEEKPKKLTEGSIVVNLKTKQMKTGPSTLCLNDSDVVKTHVQKTQIANIEKWNKIIEGERTEQAEMEARRDAKKVKLLVKHSQELNQEVEAVRKTSRGEPICFICMRKFPSMNKLRLHETASQLHKDNLHKILQMPWIHNMPTKNEVGIHLNAGEHGKDMNIWELSELMSSPTNDDLAERIHRDLRMIQNLTVTNQRNGVYLQ